MKHCLILGYGYTAEAFARRLVQRGGWRVSGTLRDGARAGALRAAGVDPVILPDDLPKALTAVDALLATAAPGDGGDPFLGAFGPAIRSCGADWMGYLSTTAVYGDHGGAWVDEDTPVKPESARAVQRVLAERQWLASGLPAHIFRLAGIYGPGRGPFEKVRDGTARRIVKPGQVFSRIHVDDIATVLLASLDRPNPGRIYNVCDDEPAPPEDVLAHAAALLGLPPPPEVAFDRAEMTPMARSFYAENKRVSNARIRGELGVTLACPDYRVGLAALLAEESSPRG